MLSTGFANKGVSSLYPASKNTYTRRKEGGGGQQLEDMQCFKCQQVGHLARKCPMAAARVEDDVGVSTATEGIATNGLPHSIESVNRSSGGEATPNRRSGGIGDGRGGPRGEIYVPANEPPEEELYRHGVSSGINFNRYENIDVNVTGSDVLAKVNSFEEANLHSLVMKNIRKSNYSCPTPVQKHAIPNIKEGQLYLCGRMDTVLEKEYYYLAVSIPPPPHSHSLAGRMNGSVVDL